MKISHLRKSNGIIDTIEQAQDHAVSILPYINFLIEGVCNIAFKEWKQGVRVHVLTTLDDRKFTLRAYHRDGEYKGIRLSLRESRTKEIFIMDAESIKEIANMMTILESIANQPRGEIKKPD